MKRLNYKWTAIVLFVIIALTSCSDNIRTTPSGQYSGEFQSDANITRAKRVDNGQITYVFLTTTDRKIYRPRDTVFMSPNHYILDSLNSSMIKIVLYLPVK